MAALMRTVFTSTLVGSAVGTIAEFLLEKDSFPPALQDPGRRIVAGGVTGVAFGVLKHCFGTSVAIPVVLFTLIGAEGLHRPYEVQDDTKKIKRCVGITLIGVVIGYGLHSIPSEFWNGIGDRMRFNVNLR
jgi:hypothetical protein